MLFNNFMIYFTYVNASVLCLVFHDCTNSDPREPSFNICNPNANSAEAVCTTSSGIAPTPGPTLPAAAPTSISSFSPMLPVETPLPTSSTAPSGAPTVSIPGALH